MSDKDHKVSKLVIVIHLLSKSQAPDSSGSGVYRTLSIVFEPSFYLVNHQLAN